MGLMPDTDKEVPPEIRRWNWGAFFFTWIWGLFNGTWIALLSLVPVVHFVMCLVLGAKGNEWAWQNKNWESVEAFHSYQRKWAVAALVCFSLLAFLCVAVPLGLIGWGVTTEMPEIKNMMADFTTHRRFCNYALASARRNSQVMNSLGRPLLLNGRPEYVQDGRGGTEISIPVRGSYREGTIYLRHYRHPATGRLRIDRAELEYDEGKRVVLNPEENAREEREEEARLEFAAAKRHARPWQGREPAQANEGVQVYREAIEQVLNNSEVKTVMGNEMVANVLKANVEHYGPMGSAQFEVALRGSKRSGKLDIRASRTLGRWSLNRVVLESAGMQPLLIRE